MRPPAVSGSFYPSSPSALKTQLKECLSLAPPAALNKNFSSPLGIPPAENLAIVCPHAGYIYSGKCAAHSYASCSNWNAKEITAVVIGPNHTGMGQPIAVSLEDWKTPLGAVKCDVELAQAIVEAGKTAKPDEIAHLQEHSCEVQLPFLQIVAPQARIVCICMGWQEVEYAQELGRAIFEAVKKTGRNAIAIASSDFTHYEEAKVAEKKDRAAIGKLLKMDEEGFGEMVEEEQLSICGHGPIAAAMHYAKLSGAKKCELLKYANSGEQTGDYSSVVGYAALAIR